MATTTTAPSSKLKWLLVGLLFPCLIAATAGAAWWLLAANRAHARPVASVTPAPIFVSLEPLTVNLQPNGRSRFLHVGLTFKVDDPNTQTRLNDYLPEVRSRLLTLLSNRDPESLLTAENKNQLAAEIMAAVNRPFAGTLPPQQVKQVMFTAFVLQ